MFIAPQNGWQISQYSCSYSHLRISTRDDAVDDLVEIKASPRRLEHGAALLVPAIDGGRIQPYVVLVGAVEATVARGNAEDVADAIELLQPDDELPQHGVEPRAEPPAGDERSARAGRVDAQALPWASAAVGDERGRRGGSEVEEGVAEGDVSRGDVEGGRRVEGVTGDGVGNRSLRVTVVLVGPVASPSPAWLLTPELGAVGSMCRRVRGAVLRGLVRRLNGGV
jgi:hypothetical protein